MADKLFDRLSFQGVQSPALLKHGLDKLMSSLEAQVGDLQSQITAIAAAQASADAAAVDAAAAQATADTVTRNDKITSSYVIPATVLSAADVGVTATVTIDSHTRVYGDGSQLAITGGTLTGLLFSTDYSIYYDDATCADTTPTFASTTTASNALNNFSAGRHFVGLVTTPADGSPATSGGSSPPGTGAGDRDKYSTL